MRFARGLFVVACLLSTGASAGEERLPPETKERVAEAADLPAGRERRAAAPVIPSLEIPEPETAPIPETPAIPAPERAAIASPSPPDDVPGPSPAGGDLGAETEVTLGRGTRVAAGLAFGGPIGAAASVLFLHGLSADVRDDATRVKAVCAVPIPHCAQGFLFGVEAGSGGGKVSLGIGARAHVDEEDLRGTVGLGLRASLVRTWGSPVGTEAGVTYLGPQLDLSIMKVDLSLGVLWRLGGHAGASALLSWGVGFGL